ncbi:MAG TPA: PaaI family thioesterase [Rhizomicrobium sp.]|nr:PaaI family thioesterase [Rhizomicrobium sp.]
MSEPHTPDALELRLGLERIVDRGEGGKAVLHYRATADMCHAGGVVQGGFITGWIDAAMAHAVAAKTAHALVPLSLEIKISFFKGVKPGIVTAEGWVEKLGRTTAFLEGRLLNEAGDVLAKGTSTAALAALKR